jgi:protein subunit release factor A
MLDKLAGIEARYNELERLMGDPEIAMDYERVGELNKERSQLEDIVKSYQRYMKQQEELAKEYNHVLLDLRNMGILAAVLMVVLVGLAQFI